MTQKKICKRRMLLTLDKFLLVLFVHLIDSIHKFRTNIHQPFRFVEVFRTLEISQGIFDLAAVPPTRVPPTFGIFRMIVLDKQTIPTGIGSIVIEFRLHKGHNVAELEFTSSTRRSPKSRLVRRHRRLVTFLILHRLLIPVRAFLLGQRLEIPRDDLGDLAEIGLGIGSLDVIPGGIRVQEVTVQVALGSVRVLLLLLALLGGVGVRIG